MGLSARWVLFVFLCLPFQTGFGRDLPSAVQSFFTETVEWGQTPRTHEEVLERFQLVQDQLRVALYQLGYESRKELGLTLDGIPPERVAALHAAFLPLRDLARGQKREVVKRLDAISARTELDTKLFLGSTRAKLNLLKHQYESFSRPLTGPALSPEADSASACRPRLSALRIAGGVLALGALGGGGYWATGGKLSDGEYITAAREAYLPEERRKGESDLLLLLEGDGTWGRPSAEVQQEALAVLADRYLLTPGKTEREEKAKAIERLVNAIQTGHLKIPDGFSAHHGAAKVVAIFESARAAKTLSRDYLQDNARWIVEQPSQPAALRAMLVEFLLEEVEYEKAPEKLQAAIVQALFDYTLAPESFRKDRFNSETRTNRDPVEILMGLRYREKISAESLSEMLKFLQAQPAFAAALAADPEKAQAFQRLAP